MPFAHLPDRTIFTVTGEAAEDFLQTLITADLGKLGDGEMRPSALLTPQGKILFDFLIGRIPGGFRLDCAKAAAADLTKRLILYRLRTKVVIEPVDKPVLALWDVAGPSGDLPHNMMIDRRFADTQVWRVYGKAPAGALAGIEEASREAFRALRIQSGIAEAETDFPGSDVFPHDVLYDQNGGVSFKKGCFVGQEVVSRMQHRGTARRRLMLLSAQNHLTPGASILAGEGETARSIGTVLAATGRDGFGFLRIDRLADALAAGRRLSADGVPLDASIPSWAGFALPATAPDLHDASDDDATDIAVERAG